MIDILAQFSFLRPGWLWLLCIVPLLLLAGLRPLGDDVWRRVVDPHLLPQLLDGSRPRRGRRRWALAALAFALAVLATAGPSWRHAQQPVWQPAAPLMIVLDLSRATLQDDIAPSRLLQAKARIASLAEGRSSGQLGLVVFAEDAFTVAPMTDEAGNVAMFLDALAPDIMPADGHRPERGLQRAARMLDQAGFVGGDILLMTHGANVQVRDTAASLARDGYRISVLGLGGDRPVGNAGETGIDRRLDEGSLRAVADAGNGRYARISFDASGLDALQLLEALPAGHEEPDMDGISVRVDDGYWLLLPLLLLVLFAFRRGALLPVLALGLCLPAMPALAQSTGTLFERQDQLQHRVMTRGVEAYRSEHYDEAIDLWSGLDGPVAAYNRGNALVRSGRYQEALSAYDDALRMMPDMDDAIANRRAVEAYLRRQPPPQSGGGDGEEGAGPSQPSGDEPASPSDSSQAGRSEDESDQQRQDSSDPRSTGPESAPEQDVASVDAETREEIENALREALESALQAEQERQSSEGSAEPEVATDDAGREQREAGDADEALLRRVHDDPGGLLRARFLLEHQQRRRGDGR